MIHAADPEGMPDTKIRAAERYSIAIRYVALSMCLP
jgi:hypothetical protein